MRRFEKRLSTRRCKDGRPRIFTENADLKKAVWLWPGRLFLSVFLLWWKVRFYWGFERFGWWRWWFCGYLVEKSVGSVVCGWSCFWGDKIGTFWKYFLRAGKRQRQKTEADPYGMTSKKGKGKIQGFFAALRMTTHRHAQNDDS